MASQPVVGAFPVTFRDYPEAACHVGAYQRRTVLA